MSLFSSSRPWCSSADAGYPVGWAPRGVRQSPSDTHSARAVKQESRLRTAAAGHLRDRYRSAPVAPRLHTSLYGQYSPRRPCHSGGEVLVNASLARRRSADLSIGESHNAFARACVQFTWLVPARHSHAHAASAILPKPARLRRGNTRRRLDARQCTWVCK